MAGVYIHIPFCKSRCIYCGFYSTTGREEIMDRYVDCLIKELRLRKENIYNERANTIYIGGGTPSLLAPKHIKRLHDEVRQCFHTDNILEEFTVECNPDDVTKEYAIALSKAGVTRVSMGVQTFSDERLQFLRRRHKSADIAKAVQNLRVAGIKNISIDLMFGFPCETVEEWSSDIDKAIALGVEHISAYSLMYEEGTPLYRLLEQGKINPIGEDTSREMFEVLIDKLERAGYEHYEISNFALDSTSSPTGKGFRSVHNSSYWHDVPYLGLGASAHSYNRTERQWNISDITRYMQSIEQDTVPCEREEIDEVTHYNDIVTTAMRTKEGIDLTTLPDKYRQYIVDSAQKAIHYGNLMIENNHLKLTRQGIYISDDIMANLIYV